MSTRPVFSLSEARQYCGKLSYKGSSSRTLDSRDAKTRVVKQGVPKRALPVTTGAPSLVEIGVLRFSKEEVRAGLEKSFLCQSQNFSDRARAPFCWSHFLSTCSQSFAKTQNLRRKKKAIFEASFCNHLKTNIINEMIASSFFCNRNRWKTNKKKEPSRKKLCRIHSHETQRGRGRGC